MMITRNVETVAPPGHFPITIADLLTGGREQHGHPEPVAI
jgi:hypothetical protein